MNSQLIAALPSLTGSATSILLFFSAHNEPTIVASYEDLMQGCGIKSRTTISRALHALIKSGLVQKLAQSTYRLAGSPQNNEKIPQAVPESPQTETISAPVVSCYIDQQDQKQLTNKQTHANHESLAPVQGVPQSTLSNWVVQFGLAYVKQRIEWYTWARKMGKANGPGWLAASILRGWDMPYGYDPDDLLSREEREAKKREKWLAYCRQSESDYPDDIPEPAPPQPEISHETSRVWQTAYGDLQLQLPRETFDAWLRNARLLSCEGEVFTIGVDNQYAVEWLKHRLHKVVSDTLRRIAEKEVSVNYVLLPHAANRGV
jgi:hypothetical protein